MRVLMLVDVDDPVDDELSEDDVEREEMDVLDALSSVDTEEALKEQLVGWTLSSDSTVSILDARKIERPKDRRRLARFALTRWGSLRQTV